MIETYLWESNGVGDADALGASGESTRALFSSLFNNSGLSSLSITGGNSEGVVSGYGSELACSFTPVGNSGLQFEPYTITVGTGAVVANGIWAENKNPITFVLDTVTDWTYFTIVFSIHTTSLGQEQTGEIRVLQQTDGSVSRSVGRSYSTTTVYDYVLVEGKVNADGVISSVLSMADGLSFYWTLDDRRALVGQNSTKQLVLEQYYNQVGSDLQISFGPVPRTFDELEIVMTYRTAGSKRLVLRLNNGTGTYTSMTIEYSGAAVSGKTYYTGNPTQSTFNYIYLPNIPAFKSYPGWVTTILIPSYSMGGSGIQGLINHSAQFATEQSEVYFLGGNGGSFFSLQVLHDDGTPLSFQGTIAAWGIKYFKPTETGVPKLPTTGVQVEPF